MLSKRIPGRHFNKHRSKHEIGRRSIWQRANAASFVLISRSVKARSFFEPFMEKKGGAARKARWSWRRVKGDVHGHRQTGRYILTNNGTDDQSRISRLLIRFERLQEHKADAIG